MKAVNYSFLLALMLMVSITYGQKINNNRNKNFMKGNFVNLYNVKPATSFTYIKPDSLGIISFTPPFQWKNNLFINGYDLAIDKDKCAFSFPKINPSVLWINGSKLIFEYNNGNGANIYKSLIDGMAIVMPDKTFKSNVLVLKSR